MKTKAILSCLLALALSSAFILAGPLGTAFTYQGRLTDGGNAATGIYDMRFAIYDALADGSAVGGPLTNAAVTVSNGLFAVTLDFGAGVFDGNARWLEMGVATNGGGAFTALSPRQPLTPTPYAIFAGSASNLSGTLPDGRLSTNVPLLNGSQTFSGANSFSNAGNAFTGSGAGLTGLNASSLASGTVPSARL